MTDGERLFIEAYRLADGGTRQFMRTIAPYMFVNNEDGQTFTATTEHPYERIRALGDATRPCFGVLHDIPGEYTYAVWYQFIET